MPGKKPIQSQPNPEEESLTLSKFAGLKNTVTPERLGPDELVRATNVDLDDVGQLHRRRGVRQFGSWTNKAHSLFQAQDGRVFAAIFSAGVWGLVWVKPDGLHTGANMAVVTGRYISYTQLDGRIYYSSADASGIIDVSGEEPTFGPWGSGPNFFYSPVVNPTATLPAIRGKLLGKPPQAHLITYSNGRIYLAQGKMVWWTELWDYNHVDKTRNFWQFEADVTMLASTTQDVYVGTTEGVYFISGTADKPVRIRVMDSGVILGSQVYMPAEVGNPALMQKGPVGGGQDSQALVSIAFLTTAGWCGGQDDGVVFNYTENKFIFPTPSPTERAAAMFRRQDGMNQYLAVTNSGGTPSANTRFGDYVDAEIRRGGASWNKLTDGAKIGDRFTVYKNGVLSP